MRKLILSLVLAGIASPAMAQHSVSPPPKPKDEGPSLAVTMKFIQDKLNEQGNVGYVYARSDLNVIIRRFYLVSDVTTDAGACTLSKTETETYQIEPNQGSTYNENGQQVTGDDLNRRQVTTSTVSFKKIENVRVESMQDRDNRSFAENAHPEITTSITPAVYYLTLVASKPVFSFHSTFTVGKRPATTSDQTGKQDFITIRDEDTANRLAKAIVHAVELCGGGQAEPF